MYHELRWKTDIGRKSKEHNQQDCREQQLVLECSLNLVLLIDFVNVDSDGAHKDAANDAKG
jgi:hypothetical protein